MRSWRVSWRNLIRKKWRTFLTITAIVIGVASTAAAVSTVQTTQRMISEITEQQYGHVDYYVFSTDGVLKEGWIETTAEVDGVASTLGRFQDSFFLGSLNGASAANVSDFEREQAIVNVIGVHDMESDILDMEVVEGTLAADGIAIDETTAAVWGIRVGDEVVFQSQPGKTDQTTQDETGGRAHSGREPYQAKVTAIFRDTPQFLNPDSWSSAAGRSWQVLLPLDKLQAWTGIGDYVQEVQIKVQDDFSASFVGEKLDEALAGAETLLTQPAVVDENRVATGFEELYAILYVVGGLSLLISAFILYNTLYMTIMERKREFAIMKAVGYTPLQVKGQVFREVLLLALTGTVLGLGLGALLSIELIEMLFQSFQDNLDYDIQWTESLLVAFTAGIFIPLFAAWIPVSKASRVSVTYAIKNDGDAFASSKSYVRLGAGVLLLIPGLFVNHTAAFLPLFLGVALLFPYLFQGVKWLLAPLNSLLFGWEGTLTYRSIDRNKNRTPMTAAILSFGVTLLVFMGSLGISLTDATEELTRQTLGGDVRVRYSEPISSEQENEWRRIEGVEATAAFRSEMLVWHMGDGLKYLQMSSVTQEQMEKFPLFTYDQEDQGDLLDKLQNPRTVVLGAATYEEWGGQVGDSIVLDTFKGEKKFEVVGVVDMMQTSAGYIGFAHEDTFEEDLGVADRNEALFQVSNDKIEAVKNALLENDSLNISAILTLPETIRSRTEQTDNIIGMLNAIVGLGIVVAGIGMMNTLLMNTMEREREIGAMRAVGITRRQMLKMILSEAFFIGGSAAFVGVVMGVFIMYLTTLQGIDTWMPLPFAVSWKAVVGAVVLALLISILASFIPAKRAANVNISQALKYE